jgi:twitching motility two-component system response regulator PilG
MSSVVAKQDVEIKTFVVGALGLKDKDLVMLERILSVAKMRRRGYELVRLEVDNPESFLGIDFVLINTCDMAMVRAWRQISRKIGALGERRVIKMVSPAAMTSSGYSLHTPINPSRVLKTFDAYTIRELDYFPEFEIGAETQHDNSMVKAGIKLLHSRTGLTDASQALKVLVVDDSLPVRRQLEIEFGLMDAEVVSVASGEEALVLIQEQVFDVIFLDIVMEGMDGYSVCKKIRASANNKKTPVTLLTSRSSSFDKLKGTLAGCDAYLTKPINHNDFIGVIDRLVKPK